MSSVVALESLQLLNYISVASTAVVFYDYILTLPREVELIWMRPWSTMSTLFVVARYFGLALALFTGLGSGTGLFYMSELVGIVMEQVLTWTNVIYIFAMHAIMILRVLVMFIQPKKIQYILFFLYFLITANAIVVVFFMLGPRSGLVITNTFFVDETVCNLQFGRSAKIPLYANIPGAIFDILLMGLVMYRVRHAIEVRRMLGRRRINEYMRLLLEHSALYFVLNLAYKGFAIAMLLSSSMLFYSLAVLYTNTIPFMIYPRFVFGFRGYRSPSGGVYVSTASEGTRYGRSDGYSRSSSGTANESGEYEMCGATAVAALQHASGQSY